METVETKSFNSTLFKIALPVALQSMLQSSFSIVDQVMIGSLGSTSIVAVGIAGKFSSVYTVCVGAIGAAAGIMIAQYLGAKDRERSGSSLTVNIAAALALAAAFIALCFVCPSFIMGIYTDDAATVHEAAAYLRVVSLSFIPLALNTMTACLLMCRERASVSMYTAFAAVICNTGLNYLLIFGKCGLPVMGSIGAGIATVISQWVNFALKLLFIAVLSRKTEIALPLTFRDIDLRQYGIILMPILLNKFLWSLGENVYAVIYGHLGKESLAAMTLINPVVGLYMGALSGLAAAAGVIVGKQLGAKNFDEAYSDSGKLLRAGLVGAIVLSFVLVPLRGLYTSIFNVEAAVRTTAGELLLVFAVVSPIKVLNMITGGGILRSGGDTKTVMAIDLIGTWFFGVPLGFIAGKLLGLPIVPVYFILSMEEAVRLAISLLVFRKKKWMQSITK